jgi:hypothetical protein
LDPATNFSSFFKNIFRLLRICRCRAPSLTRGRVSSLKLLLRLPIAVFLGSESSGTHDHISLSLFLSLSNPEGQVPVFISPRKMGNSVMPPGIGLLQYSQSQSQTHITTDSQSVSILGVEPNLGLLNRFFFSKLLSCLIWGALSDESSGLSFVSLCHCSPQ